MSILIYTIITGIGSTCTTSDDCNAVNDAACVNKVCVCLDSHVPHPLDNRRCLPSKLLPLCVSHKHSERHD